MLEGWKSNGHIHWVQSKKRVKEMTQRKCEERNQDGTL